MLLGGLRRRHNFAASEDGIREQWRDFGQSGHLPGQHGVTRYGVMCGADGSGFEYMCAVEVDSLPGLPPDAGRMRVPEQSYAIFIHPGPPDSLQTTWMRILEWLDNGEYESAHLPDFEVYDPPADPMSAPPGTEIWVGVVKRLP